MVFSFMFSWLDLTFIGGPITSNFWNSNVAWVPDDTPYVLPPMNVDPDFITCSGFSGGSYYCMNFAIMNSATIQGAGLKAGGPYGAGYSCSGGNYEDCNEEWRAGMVQTIKDLADEGKIDPVSNLVDMPVNIRGGALDDA